jgi:hypothetical protein
MFMLHVTHVTLSTDVIHRCYSQMLFADVIHTCYSQMLSTNVIHRGFEASVLSRLCRIEEEEETGEEIHIGITFKSNDGLRGFEAQTARADHQSIPMQILQRGGVMCVCVSSHMS